MNTWPHIDPRDPRWRRTAAARRLLLRERHVALLGYLRLVRRLARVAGKIADEIAQDALQLHEDLARCVEAELEREREAA